MRYTIQNTKFNINLTAASSEVNRLLALARIVTIKSDDVRLNLVSMVRSKNRTYLAWRVEMRTRSIIPMLDFVRLLNKAVTIPGTRLENSSLTFLP